MSHFARHFTVEEARALLPELRRAFARIHRLLEEVGKKRGAAEENPVRFFSANGHGPRVTGDSPLVAEIQKIVGGLHERGILVKDIRRGLCDFPCLLPPLGDEVLLCWELSEADITHWHTVEGGYSGRTRLQD